MVICVEAPFGGKVLVERAHIFLIVKARANQARMVLPSKGAHTHIVCETHFLQLIYVTLFAAPKRDRLVFVGAKPLLSGILQVRVISPDGVEALDPTVLPGI